MNRTDLPLALLLGMLLLCCIPLSVGADDPKKPPVSTLSRQSVEGRIANLNRLVTSSSGAQKIRNSGQQNAMEKRAQAEALLVKAKSQLAKGRLQEANSTLDQVTKEMFAAVRMIGTGEAMDLKHRKDFDDRAESLDVLLSASRRISREKGVEQKYRSIIRKAERKRAEALVLADRGKLKEGREMLDSAYESAKLAVEQLRGGDTLVRTLHFSSKKDEYHYEIDRNDTHQMLVKILLEEKMKSSSVSGMVNKFLIRASELREAADGSAQQGDYAKAVSMLEASTKELVRAIRGAGVYIPG